MSIVFAACLGGYNVYQAQEKEMMSDTMLANIEALASGESGCNNINGYKDWKTDSWFGSKREFYDCCYVLRSGYSPSGSCQ